MLELEDPGVEVQAVDVFVAGEGRRVWSQHSIKSGLVEH